MVSEETIAKSNFVVELYRDNNSTNPREWDNAGTMICWHDRYRLGDSDSRKLPLVFDSPSEFKAWWKTNSKGGVILPLYLYDHSGLTISTDNGHYPFTDRWDSGQIGYIYAIKETIIKEWGKTGKLTRTNKTKALRHLQDEVKTYDQYLTGDVYGYTITDPQGDIIDSCWGFYGFDYAKQEAQTQLDYWIAEYARREIEAQRDNVY